MFGDFATFSVQSKSNDQLREYWQMAGDQGNQWNDVVIYLPTCLTDFQVFYMQF